MGVYAGVTDNYLTQSDQTRVADSVKKYNLWAIGKEGNPGRTPALDLNFAKNKSLVDDVSGSNLVTFTRTSAATYVDSNGVIKTSPLNLMWPSNIGNTILNDGGGVSLSTDTTVVNPFGQYDGVLKCNHTSNTPGYFRRGQNITLTAGVTYTFSVYFKNGTVASPYNQSDSSTSMCLQTTTFSPTFHQLRTVLNQNIPVGDGWYRQVHTFTPAYTQTYQVNFNHANNQTPLGTYYLYGFQLEVGDTATVYAPTTTAANGAPRFDHDPVTGESLGLLIEESRTNLLLSSSSIGDSNYTVNGLPGTSQRNNSETTAPDGTLTATLIDPNGNSGTNFVYGSVGISTSTTYTYSIHVKQDQSTNFNFILDENSFGGKRYQYNFTYATETISTNITGNSDPLLDGAINSYSYKKLSNGWYRLILTFTSSSSGVSNLMDMINRNSNDSNYVWGRQLEQGAFQTSYIPTIPTFSSRSSSATYYDSNGNIKTASTNIPRANAYLPDANGDFKPIGLLLESEETNIIAFSQDPTRCSKFRVYTSASNLTVGVATITSSSPNSPSTVYITAVESVDANNCDIYIGSQTGGVYNPATFTQGGNSYSGNGNVIRQGYELYNYLGTSANIPTLSNVLSPDNVSYAYEQTGTIRLLNVSGWTTTDYSVFSVFVKAKNATSINISNEYHSTPYSTFNFTTGTWSYKNPAHEQHFVEKHPNGWYRIGVLDTYGFRGFYSSITSTDSYYCWGFQYSKSSTMTSYIPTTGSQVTRSADVTSSSSITRSVDSALLDTSNWWDYTKGTAYAEYRGGLESQQSGYGRVWSPSGAATFIAANAAHVYNNRHVVWFGGIALQVLGQEHLSSFAKNAITYSNNGTNCDIVNASYPSSTTGTTNSSVTSTSHGIGRNAAATTNMLNGHIKRMTYWEQVLDPSTLQSLTE
jgi:hypothetical protein